MFVLNEVVFYPNAMNPIILLMLSYFTILISCKSSLKETPAQSIAHFIVHTYLSAHDLKMIKRCERKFSYEAIDLNNDGDLEYFIRFFTAYFCGSGGCNILILNSKFQLITDFSNTSPLIYVDSNTTNGWRNLFLWSNRSYFKIIYNKTIGSYCANSPTKHVENLSLRIKQRSHEMFKDESYKKVYAF